MATHGMMRCEDWDKCKNCTPCAFNRKDICTECVRRYGNDKNVLNNDKDNFEAK